MYGIENVLTVLERLSSSAKACNLNCKLDAASCFWNVLMCFHTNVRFPQQLHLYSIIQIEMKVYFPIYPRLDATAACSVYIYFEMSFPVSFLAHNKAFYSEDSHPRYLISIHFHLVSWGCTLRAELKTDLHIHHHCTSSARLSVEITGEMSHVL